MTTTIEEKPAKMLVQYSPNDTAIAELKASCEGLTADTPERYEIVRRSIATTRSYRTAIEKRRVELKADALAWGRKVDSEAKRLTGLLLEIEEPLKAAKNWVDERVERERRAAEAVEQARVEAEAKAKRDAEESAYRAQREAEQAKLSEERKRLDAEREAEVERTRVERERLAEERAKIEAERKAADAERQKLNAERIRLERIELEAFQAKRRAEREAKEAAEAARLEAMRPDVEKIQAFGAAIRSITLPEVNSEDGQAFVKQTCIVLISLAASCESFGGES